MDELGRVVVVLGGCAPTKHSESWHARPREQRAYREQAAVAASMEATATVENKNKNQTNS